MTNDASYAPVYRQPTLPDVIRCANHPDCGWMVANTGAGMEDDTVAWLREGGWQVVDGAWTCPQDVPAHRRRPPPTARRTLNPHCTSCGDTRGGPYGHEAYECTWNPTQPSKESP